MNWQEPPFEKITKNKEKNRLFYDIKKDEHAKSNSSFFHNEVIKWQLILSLLQIERPPGGF